MATTFHLISVCIILTFSSVAVGSNVLIVPLTGEGSHLSVVDRIALEMINRGHNITMLVADYYKEKLVKSHKQDGYNVISFASIISQEEYHQVLANVTDAALQGKFFEWLLSSLNSDFQTRQVQECRDLLKNKELMSKLRNSNFDLALQDNSHSCPVVQYLRKEMGIPFVAVSPVSAFLSGVCFANRWPFNPSYMPELTTAYDHVMNFQERLYNTGLTLFFYGFLASFSQPYDKLKQDLNISDVTMFYEDAELFLVNTNYALDFPKPTLPSTIAVGGLTVKPHRTLDKEWLDFLESAGEEGVVLFSTGTYAKGIDENVAAVFARAFSKLKQNVIWKLNGEPSADVPPNVKVVDWIPQNDLLAHPQIKVFVYHCGVNGIWEAVYHGVPMVAMPLFGDQFDNAQRLVSKGMAVKVDISTLTSDELANAITTVASDASFKKNAKRVSAIFRDTPRTPTETAADWLEYVIRHGGAAHLRSAALDLNIFQYFLIDVFAVILLSFTACVLLVFCSCKVCLKCCKKVCTGSTKIKKE